MNKQPLSPVVRHILIKSYGSIAAAAKELEFESYERLRKSVQRNNFSVALLGVLFPGRSLSDLQEEYDFKITRMSHRTPETAKTYRHVLINIINEEDWQLISENVLICERVAKLVSQECARLRKVLAS